jgi:hypothetical protein
LRLCRHAAGRVGFSPEAAAAARAQVVTPGSERIVRGEGMPVSKAPGQKGNLRLQMDVQARSRAPPA